MYDITVSIVTYKTQENDLLKVIHSFLDTKLSVKLFISDNSPNNSIKNIIDKLNDSRIEYIFNNYNGGYGYGHNKVLNKIEKNSKYHVISNSDIYFEKGVLEELYNYMENNKTIGNVMPMVKYPSGEIQYLCKRDPRLKDLFLRRFCPFKEVVQKNNFYYEMRDKNYFNIMEVPLLSGCFMFLRTSFFIEIKGFDERFFMYMEDFDLCRRLRNISRLVYYPKVEIVHNHAKESYKSWKMTWIHIKSAIKYFIKYRNK